MRTYKIIESKGFLEDLSKDFHGQKEWLEHKLKTYAYPQLSYQPYFGKNIKKLRDYKPDTWRYRIGDYRFFYEIDDRLHLVIMIAADNRSTAY